MAKKKQFDYVVSLISGRFQGTTFIPQTENPNPPLAYLRKVGQTSDITEDQLLVNEGLRIPLLTLNRGEFQKSNKERRNLKYAKKVHNRLLRNAGFNPKKVLNIIPVMEAN